jgi:hypothetical protein
VIKNRTTFALRLFSCPRFAVFSMAGASFIPCVIENRILLPADRSFLGLQSASAIFQPRRSHFHLVFPIFPAANDSAAD